MRSNIKEKDVQKQEITYSSKNSRLLNTKSINKRFVSQILQIYKLFINNFLKILVTHLFSCIGLTLTLYFSFLIHVTLRSKSDRP